MKVQEIKDWAMANYDEGGHWIIETMTDDEIFDEFANLQEAIDWAERLQDIQEDIQNA
ncbi:MAG: hypothetical protein ACK6DA_14985 [Candidatus Kapaibacterium sp.]|jgi:hypothetical protein|nr:hypothetical protein [Cryomorphaceae bacterium]